MRRELEAIVGADHVLSEETQLLAHSRDKSPFEPVVPAAVVRPGSVEEISELLRWARRRRTPVLPRGGGFSVTGFGAVPDRSAVVIDVHRLDRVLDIDEESYTVTAEAGIRTWDLDAAVTARGMQVNTVLVPIRYTTLGGVLSGVVGGGLPRDSAIAGNNVQHLLALTVVLPDGTVVSTNAGGSNRYRTRSALPDGDGPFVTPLFVGDGGTLGIKVSATLQIQPAPTERHADAWEVSDFDVALAVLRDLRRLRIMPCSILYATEGRPWLVGYVCEADDAERLTFDVRTVEQALRRNGARPGSDEQRVAASELAVPGGAWAEEFVQAHRALFAFMFSNADFPAAFRAVRDFLDQRMRERGLPARGLSLKVLFSPQGRHAIYTTISIVYDPSAPGGREETARLAQEGYELVARLGGYFEPHQGLGARILSAAWSPAYRDLLTTIKMSLDPDDLVSPGLWTPPAAAS